MINYNCIISRWEDGRIVLISVAENPSVDEVPVVEVFHPGLLAVGIFEQLPAAVETGVRRVFDVGVLPLEFGLELRQPLLHAVVDFVELQPGRTAIRKRFERLIRQRLHRLPLTTELSQLLADHFLTLNVGTLYHHLKYNIILKN